MARSTVWQRGVAVALAIPALALLLGRLPNNGSSTSIAFHAGTFFVASIFLLNGWQKIATEFGALSWWLSTLLFAALFALTLSHVTNRWALSLLVASTEEVVFRACAISFVLGNTSRRPVDVASALLASQFAFATSHFSSGALPWTIVGWLSLAAAGGCLGILRISGGLTPAIILHFALNEANRTGSLGVFLPPGPLPLAAIALAAPTFGAIAVARADVAGVLPPQLREVRIVGHESRGLNWERED